MSKVNAKIDSVGVDSESVFSFWLRLWDGFGLFFLFFGSFARFFWLALVAVMVVAACVARALLEGERIRHLWHRHRH